MVFPIVGGDGKPTGYEIENSLRFNDDDSAKLGITFSSGGNRKTYTISFWVKRGHITAQQNIFGTPSEGDTLYFDGGDRLRFFQNGSASSYLGTNRLFRDPSAWYHIVVAVDTNQSTSTNRVKLYINGSQYTWDASTTYPAEDYEGDFNHTADEHMIGNGHHGNSFDGYISEFHFIDGTQYAASNFGETNDNGVWIPKAFTGTFGSNGFLCEFKQTGTSANASGIGADTSGNGNHLTPSNLAATDVTVDTPTNNFATINPLANYFNPATLSEGNTRVDFANDVSTSYVISTIGVASGKWYCEVKGVDIPSYGEIGIASRPRQDDGNDDKLTTNQYNYGYTANNGNVKSNSTAGSSYGNSYSDGDMIGIAMDLDNNKLYFSKNGTWQNSGDPTSGSTGTGAFSIVASSSTHDGVYYFAGGSNVNNDDTRMDFNFGNPAFSISSGNSDANGYGNFEYAVPSGYYSLCTKNLAEFG